MKKRTDERRDRKTDGRLQIDEVTDKQTNRWMDGIRKRKMGGRANVRFVIEYLT